jgi:hypothetical protein
VCGFHHHVAGLTLRSVFRRDDHRASTVRCSAAALQLCRYSVAM